MINAFLPIGSFHGWGVCGKYIVKELSKLTEIRLTTNNIEFDNLLDEFDYRLLKSKLVTHQENEDFKNNFPMLLIIILRMH